MCIHFNICFCLNINHLQPRNYIHHRKIKLESLSLNVNQNKFDSDEEEIKRIMEMDWTIDDPTMFEGNKMKKNVYVFVDPINTQSKTQDQPVFNDLRSPNTNWRSAMKGKPTLSSFAAIESSIDRLNDKKLKKPLIVAQKTIIDVDLDYEDFELAMLEEEYSYGLIGSKGNPNINGGLNKVSALPIEHEGLHSGDCLPSKLWEYLMDAEGKPCVFSQVHRDLVDIVVIFADPRRMTEDFKLIMQQLGQLPSSILKIAPAAINCDDRNDHRKYLKKNPNVKFSLLNDPTKKVMDLFKCRSSNSNRLLASLIILEVKSGCILKVWYENDWDAFETKDLIIEEVQAYRRNPRAYLESQIGIR